MNTADRSLPASAPTHRGTTAPLISIAILSFNSKHLLPRAVQSVREQEHRQVELIIVDNASTDGTSELLNEYEHEAKVIRLLHNTGFARGMNTGYAASQGDYFVPLNTDAVLHPKFLVNALDRFDQHSKLGVIAAEVLKIPDDGEWRFWNQPAHDFKSEGGVVSLNRQMRVHVIEDGYAAWRPSFKANGACPIVRRELIEQMQQTFGAAPFDPVFDTYGEDVDFAFKAWALGWETMYAPEVLAGHVRSYASALELPDKRGRLRINLIAERYINALRHLPPAKLLPVLVRAHAEDAMMCLRQLGKGDREIITDMRVAFARVWHLLPSLLRFRREHRTWTKIDFPREVHNEVL